MKQKRARCPGCATILAIPEDYPGDKVLCSLCDTRFRLPSISDGEILDWLGRRNKDDTFADEEQDIVELPRARHEPEPKPTPVFRPKHPRREETPASVSPVDFSIGSKGLKLVRVDRRGALFEFPARLLEDLSFRGAVPRCCIRCGCWEHLIPHVVVFEEQMTDPTAVESSHVHGRLDAHQASEMTTAEVLEALPLVEGFDPPLDLPMPFWVCDMCSPSNMVIAHHELRPNEMGIEEVQCYLLIRRLWRAEEFLLACGGEDTAAHHEIQGALKAWPQTSWDRLPGMVQQRLRQWFRAGKGEVFTTYIPQRLEQRTDAGLAGIVLSNRRLMYHSAAEHRESLKGQRLQLRFHAEGNETRLAMIGSLWDISDIPMERRELHRLRRELAAQGFNVTWL